MKKMNLVLKPVILTKYVLFLWLSFIFVTNKTFANSANSKCSYFYLSLLQQTQSNQGHFVDGGQIVDQKISNIYIESKNSGSLNQPPKGKNVERVQENDISVDLTKLSPMSSLDIKKRAKEMAPSLYYVTSGAGLWSRGAGQVKALVPFNLKEVLSLENVNLLEKFSLIATASSPDAAIKAAGKEIPNEELEKANYAERLVSDAKNQINKLLKEAREDKRALTPLDMKLANVALLSEVAETYVPFDIWTSQQTHQDIAQYLNEFNQNFHTKTFHADLTTNEKIISALRKYINDSKKRNETHLFGMQIGVHALNPSTGDPLIDTVAIGEGAGMLKTYLDKSGRTQQLQKMGKQNLLFDNIEVVTDLESVIAAHSISKTPTSVVVVEQRSGYSGGNPFKVTKEDGSTSIELHEQSALPTEFATGNSYFNSNTIVMSLDTAPFYTLGFETKTDKGHKIVRVKLNAGDVTKTTKTAAILGRIGIDYENFKNYIEYATNGGSLIQAFQNIWVRALNTVSTP